MAANVRNEAGDCVIPVAECIVITGRNPRRSAIVLIPVMRSSSEGLPPLDRLSGPFGALRQDARMIAAPQASRRTSHPHLPGSDPSSPRQRGTASPSDLSGR